MPTPKKTAPEHWLSGTKSQAEVPPNEELAFAAGRPKYPRGISGEARAAFKRLVRLLESRRVLTEADGELLRLYAITFDRHSRALEKLAEEGEVRIYTRLNNHGEEVEAEKPNLWLRVAETAEKNMVAILDRLGLTPLNRSKVKPTRDKAPQPEGGMEEIFTRRPAGPAFVVPEYHDEELIDAFKRG